MGAVSNAVEKRDTGPVAVMWSRRKHYDAVLPAHIDVESFLGLAAGGAVVGLSAVVVLAWPRRRR